VFFILFNVILPIVTDEGTNKEAFIPPINARFVEDPIVALDPKITLPVTLIVPVKPVLLPVIVIDDLELS
jgi:hypothetical protein